MKKILSAAALLFCLAGSLYAEGYLYPKGPSGGADQSCPGCPAPRTNDSTPVLDKVWPYSDPIVNFHRFVDSLWVKDWQQPIRTIRAFNTRVAIGAKYPRIYMRLGGGMLAAYDIDRFPQRLANREELVAGARRTTLMGQFEGYDLYLRPDSYFYPEDDATGWTTPLTDGQERLYAFDWDDRGYVYMSYTHFGWGIALDDGGNSGNGTLMKSVYQNYGEQAPNNIFVIKTSGGRYYAYVNEIGVEPKMRVYDVTNPAAPVRTTDHPIQVYNPVKMGNYIGVIGASGIEIYTSDSFVSRQNPFAVINENGYTMRALTTDGERLYAAAIRNNGNAAIFTIDVTGTSAVSRITDFGKFTPGNLAAHGGYLTIYGFDSGGGDVRLFKVSGGTPEEINLNGWVQKYYVKPPPGYVRPPSDQTSFYYAAPLKAGTKLFIMLSAYALGDVIEIKSEDSIVVTRQAPHISDEIYYGDTVSFMATNGSASAPPRSVSWDFGNPEGSLNSGLSTTGQPVSHQYNGFSSATTVTRNVKAVATGGGESSVAVTIKAPSSRFRILGNERADLLFAQPNASSPAPIVLGDFFVDTSDGDSTGHTTTWTLDGTATNGAAGSTQTVGACGTHTLAFTTNHGGYVQTISPFTYAVRPYAADIDEGTHSPTHLNFVSASRGSTSSPANQLISQWDLVNSANQVLLAGGTGNTFAVPKANVAAGSRVRLKVAHPTAPSGACASMSESVAYFTIPNPPDPIINGGCQTGGNAPCVFTVASATGADMTAWTNSWSVTGAGASPTSGTGTSFTPTFTQGGSFTVSLTSTNAVASVAATPKSGTAVAASLCPDMVPGTNIFLRFNGTGCSENGGTCAPGQTILFNVGSFLNYSMSCATHTFVWSIAGQQYTTQTVPNIVLPTGSNPVSVVVSNGRETKTLTATVNVGSVVQPPVTPPVVPPVNPPTPGGCGTMNSSNVFVTFAAPNNACNELNPANCPAGQNIVFNAGSLQFGGSAYSFSCANHTFNWTIDGQSKSGQLVNHTFTTSGPKAISLTINNTTQQFTTGATLTVVGGGTTPPPVTPPVNPPTGNCPTMNAVNTFIAYNDAFQSCNQNNPSAPCPAGQLIDFRATFFNYNFNCATHTYTWTFPGNVERIGQNVQHAFSNGNGQLIKLRVSNGTQTFDTQATINFGGGSVTPEFEVSIDKAVVTGNLYKFTPVITPASAASSIHTYSWNFGDGKTLDTQLADPVFHEYTPACPSCSVTLTVKAASGQAIVPPVTEALTPSRRRSARH